MTRTITDDVGASAPIIATEDGQREAASVDREAHTISLNGSRVWRDYALRPDDAAKAGAIVTTLDNGPQKPANDNLAKPQRYHLKEIYERGELGINEIENRRHWFDAERLKELLATAACDPIESNEWRELMLPYFDDGMSSLDSDNGLQLNDDLEFEDTSVPADCTVVDNEDHTPTAIRILHARQVVDLAADVLGRDFQLLRTMIADNWTARMIGETEGFTDRTTASACGKGMLRAALRNLSRFLAGLDRLEERGERPHDRWRLVGTLNWPIAKYPEAPRWTSYLNQARGPVIKKAA
ncbi:hypothetical protein QA649_34510 [Bradyrhizobium sp. CB1717]|uniref:hypothetical protein n=1 Tax=Bradyrhizobium sp. CB1717 TaxID=3039154 RepID=UPI0024B10D43|nr:hypothetical protein [Bradyrhizobium sp. CB1717]WFU23156.1 hypothetical protein QA649_34510 [Bradyrhizobium sp. CB1717]